MYEFKTNPGPKQKRPTQNVCWKTIVFLDVGNGTAEAQRGRVDGETVGGVETGASYACGK